MAALVTGASTWAPLAGTVCGCVASALNMRARHKNSPDTPLWAGLWFCPLCGVLLCFSLVTHDGESIKPEAARRKAGCAGLALRTVPTSKTGSILGPGRLG